MTGTGFMKCIPITLSGLWVTEAILDNEMEEVFEAKMAFLGAISSSFSNKTFFTLKSSIIA